MRKVPAAGRTEPSGFEPPEHSALTFEGEIETLGRLARGLRSSSPRQRWAARALMLPVLAGFVIGLVVVVVQIVSAIL